MITTKVCITCGQSKALGGFYRDVRNKDNATSECRECIKARRRRDRSKERERERVAGYERQKRWQANHPETRRAVQAVYRERHRQEINARARARYHERKGQGRLQK